MEGEIEHSLLMCMPCGDNQVTIADSVLEVGDGNCVNLIVENHSVEAVQLKKGAILGEDIEVEEVTSGQALAVGPIQTGTGGETLQTEQEKTGGEVTGGATANSGSEMAHGVVAELCEDRGARLLRALNLSIAHLSPTQQRQLEDLLRRHSDVFALEACELDIVNHTIDTCR